MDFQPDHNFPGAGGAFQHVSHYALNSGNAENPAAFSNAAETENTVSSSKCLPITCRPKGSPSALSPAGTLIAGTPASEAGTVNTSFRYIVTGSSIFSPIPKAAEGAVGVKIASTLPKASVKSRRINARIFCAFR